MLTEHEKRAIKRAILKAVGNGCQEPEVMLTKIVNTFERIDKIGRASVMNADCESHSTDGKTY